MRRAVLPFLLLLTVSGVASVGSAPDYAKRLWQAQDGLPDEIVHAFAQTRDGYLWIGTQGGLLRFDGQRFVLYDRGNTPGLTESGVNCLLAARDGSLWIGTEGGGVVRYQNHSFHPYPTADGQSNSFVRTVFEDSKGTIWVGADQGLYRVAGKSLQRLNVVDEPPSLYVRAIAEDLDGRIWVGGTRLLQFKGTTVRDYPLPGGPSRSLIQAMHTARNGTVWVGTLSGLFRLENTGTLQRVPGIASTVRALAESFDGKLWIATAAGGAFVYQSGAFSKMSAPEFLPSNTVFAIFEDSERDVWIGTQAGMLRLSQTPVSLIRLPGAADAERAAVYGDRDGSVWAAFNSLFQIQNGIVKHSNLAGVSDVRVRTVMRDAEGGLWIGTDGEGLLHVVGDRVEHMSTRNGLANDFVRVIVQSRDRSVWVGTDGGVSKVTSQGITGFGTGLSYFCITALIEDHLGDIWIGTYRGLNHLHGGVYVQDSATEALKGEKLWSIHEDPELGLWFGTSNGLYSFKSGKLSHFTEKQGLGSDIIYQILEDGNSNFWLSSPNGISRINRLELESAARSSSSKPIGLTVFATSQGLNSAEPYGGIQPAGFLGRRGDVWFASNKGLIHISPNENGPNQPLNLVIDKTSINGQEILANGPIILKPGITRVEISFATILLRSQEAVRYRSKLEGFDEWSSPSDNHTASYTNLPPGKYRFRVQAFELNNPSAVSETDLAIRQRPFFYRTWWFLMLCLSITAVVIFAIHRIRIRSVRDRYLGALEERNRVAREMHDTLIQGCTTVSTLLEACSLTDGPQTRGLLDHARAQIRTIAYETRKAVWNLRHDQTAPQRFDNLLQDMAAKFRQDFKIPIDLSVKGRPIRLDHRVVHELLLVMREALHNAVRHSYATRILINLKYHRTQLSIQITDDGCGFDVDSVLKSDSLHYGLKGMAERIRRIHGDFDVQSSAGLGTSITMRIPKTGSLSTVPAAEETVAGNKPLP